MPTTTELLGLAVDKNPVDFADTFNSIMMQKAAEAVDARRVELAQSIYGTNTVDTEDEFEDFDDETVDDASNDDLEDIDLDLDLDIEDFADAEDTE